MGVAGALLIVIIAQAVMLHSQGWRMAWGTVPDLLGALGGIGTILALVIAWAVYRADTRARRDDVAHRKQSDRQKQAEMVTAWIIGVGSNLEATDPYVDVGLNNDSNGVVYDVRILVRFYPTSALAHFEVPEFGLESSVAGSHFPELPPGSWSVAVLRPDENAYPGEVEVYFRDQRTVPWRRGPNGVLTGDASPPYRVSLPEFWNDQQNGYVITEDDIFFPRRRPKLRRLPTD